MFPSIHCIPRFDEFIGFTFAGRRGESTSAVAGRTRTATQVIYYSRLAESSFIGAADLVHRALAKPYGRGRRLTSISTNDNRQQRLTKYRRKE
jgi:hypothetical protein